MNNRVFHQTHLRLNSRRICRVCTASNRSCKKHRCISECKNTVWGIVGFTSQQRGNLISVISTAPAQVLETSSQVQTTHRPADHQSRRMLIKAYCRATWPLSRPCNCNDVILESRHNWKKKPIGTLFLTSRDESFGHKIIEQYPALIDNLFSSSNFKTLHHTR